MEATVDKFRALSTLYDILAAAFEYRSRGRLLSQDSGFMTHWKEFSWKPDFDDDANPFDAWLLINQPVAADEDASTEDWAFTQDATLVDQLGISHDFLNGMTAGFFTPEMNSKILLDEYNANCAISYCEYDGELDSPSSCDNVADFELGVKMGRKLFRILNKASAL